MLRVEGVWVCSPSRQLVYKVKLFFERAEYFRRIQYTSNSNILGIVLFLSFNKLLLVYLLVIVWIIVSLLVMFSY